MLVPRGPDGTARSSWQAIAIAALAALPALGMFAESAPWPWLAPFLGRMHPLVLHFPIALLLAALVFELALLVGPFRSLRPGSDLRGVAPALLFAGAMMACVAMTAGWLLMRNEGREGPLVERHMQGGIALAAVTVTTLLVRLLPAWAKHAAVRWVYRGLLLAMGALILRTSHDGGSLTHGEDYLTEYAPWTPQPPPFQFPTIPPAEWDYYAHVVTPILEARCYQCHRGTRSRGRLALDSYEGLVRGGDTGLALVPGKPEKSLLLTRIALPPEHNEHMPPRRRPQPTPEEVQVLRRWVTLGAPASGSLSALKLDATTLATIARLPELVRINKDAMGTVELDPAAVAKLRAPLATTVRQLGMRFPGVLEYESRQSANLRLNASVAGSHFDDDALAAFAPLAEHLVWCDLTGTKVTDRSAVHLGAMKKLQVLRLTRTGVTDLTAQSIATLPELKSVGLFGTAITPAVLPVFSRVATLEKLYVGGTTISAATPCPPALRDKLVF
jgi:uncharacterized membrane protein